jgi:hypothetical protein
MNPGWAQYMAAPFLPGTFPVDATHCAGIFKENMLIRQKSKLS